MSHDDVIMTSLACTHYFNVLFACAKLEANHMNRSVKFDEQNKNRNPDQNAIESNESVFRDRLNNNVKKLVTQKIDQGKIRPRWLLMYLLHFTRKKERFYVRAQKSGLNSHWEKLKSIHRR